MQFRHLFHGAAALILALAAAAPAGAVELGEVIMRSHLGQPLSADVELTGLAADNVPVQVGLADADVYRGASIAMHPALSAASITTFRRDGRRYLHIGSMVATRSDHVPIFFTLTENGQVVVRQVTLWLTPDPNPAPPPPPPEPVAAPVLAAAIPAFAPPVLAKTVLPTVPATAPVKFIPPPASVAHAVTLPQTPRAAACASSKNIAVDDAACVALDAKNAALNAHLVELEDKVKQLSAALQTAAAPPVHAALPRAVPMPAKLVPMGAQPPERSGSTPWLVLGIVAALILSLVAGLTAVLLRQRKKGKLKRKATELIAATAAPKPSFIASVKKRLMPGRSAPAAAAQASELPQEVADTVPAL